MNISKCLLISITGLMTVGAVNANTIYTTSALAELTGSRSMPSTAGVDVLAGGKLNVFDISWTITPTANEYHYVYMVSGTTGTGLGVSHFALELSDSCTSDAACIKKATFNGLDVQNTLNFGANSSDKGDPGLPTSFYGVRFAPSSATQLPIIVEFDSDRTPVYGDFYVKLGQGTAGHGGSAWNYGNSLGNDSMNNLDFIPRPDTFRQEGGDGGTVPEPATYALLGCGLALLGLIRRRERC